MSDKSVTIKEGDLVLFNEFIFKKESKQIGLVIKIINCELGDYCQIYWRNKSNYKYLKDLRKL